MLVLCAKLNVSGDVLLFLCSGLDDRSARPMTGDGRKRGGMEIMWSFDVKLSEALSHSSCGALQMCQVAEEVVWNFAAGGDDLFGFLLIFHLPTPDCCVPSIPTNMRITSHENAVRKLRSPPSSSIQLRRRL
jgi:hypothetical protein